MFEMSLVFVRDEKPLGELYRKRGNRTITSSNTTRLGKGKFVE